MITEFKRVKHGELPGDISRWAKIRMRENKGRKGTAFNLWPWQRLNEKLSKSFRRYLLDKSRTVQRRRDKEAIHAQSDD